MELTSMKNASNLNEKTIKVCCDGFENFDWYVEEEVPVVIIKIIDRVRGHKAF